MSETTGNGPGTPPPQAQLFALITGKFVTQAVHVIAKLGVADKIAGGPKTADELARETGSHPDALGRVLQAAAAIGLLAESGGRFSLTPTSQLLRSDVEGSLRAFAVFLGEPFHTQAWARLADAVATGSPAFDAAHGMDAFAYFAKEPAAGRVFDEAMTSFTSTVAPAVAAAYDISFARRIVDVGGGRGLLLRTLVERHPEVRGVLYDLPAVANAARLAFEEAGLATRLEAVGGSFFDSVPAGSDLYLMKHIIHDWDDARATKILANCRAAMAEGGKVAIVEVVLPASAAHPTAVQARLMDLEMLAMTPGGRERTEEDYAKLLAGCGLRLTRVVPTEAPVSVIEAVAG